MNRDASILFGKREDFVGSLSQSGTFAADPQGSGEGGGCPFFDLTGGAWWTGMEEMVAGEIWMIARSISYFSSFLSPHEIVFFIFIRYNRPFAD